MKSFRKQFSDIRGEEFATAVMSLRSAGDENIIGAGVDEHGLTIFLAEEDGKIRFDHWFGEPVCQHVIATPELQVD